MFYSNVGGALPTGNSTNQTLIDMYSKLASVTRTINTLMKEYSQGNFYEVANTLTTPVYNRISLLLGSLAADEGKYPDYEIIRQVSTEALGGMYQAVLQYSSLVDTKNKLMIVEEHDSILYDPVKLQDWINGLKQRRSLFPESKVQVRAATLKPEYALYVQIYGFPPGAVFEPDRMSAVLNMLNMRDT
jgi:hypothetical protein